MDITQSQNGVLHQNVAQVLDRGDADAVIKQEQYLMEQEEGTIKTFDVPLRREIYRVMKQWTKLPDGQRVIIGVVVSNPWENRKLEDRDGRNFGSSSAE